MIDDQEVVSWMRYDIRIERKIREVEISRKESSAGEETYSVTLHHQTRRKQSEILVLERRRERLVVSIDNKVYSITQLKRSPISVTFVANGRLQVADLKTRFEEEGLELGPPVSEYVNATLPARVVKVEVRAGDSLKQGTEMLVLEAMKMEVQILAPKDCKVKEVYVKEGETIEKGKRLLWLNFNA
jgi:biotin carboxyl carrier protein